MADYTGTSEQSFSSYYTAGYPNLTSSIDKAPNNPYLLDMISNHYIFEEQVHMSFNILRKYEQLIRANVETIDMKPEWKYKPEYLSFDYYGTTDFWYLIMFVNNIYTPLQFTMDKVTLCTEEFVGDSFKNIISKEINMKNSMVYPTMIYKHILKDLNSSSKQVLPSDFNNALNWNMEFKKYEDKTSLLDLSNYKASSELMINGVLKTSFKKGNNKNSIRPIYKNYTYNANYEEIDFYGNENYYSGGYIDNLGSSTEKIITIQKEGKLKVFKTGTYYFKLISCGNFSIFIDGKNVVNSNTPDFLNTSNIKNIIEEYSLNSDFKRRNLKNWYIGERVGLSNKGNDSNLSLEEKANIGDIIVYDDYLNKEVLITNCDDINTLYNYTSYNKLDNNNLICGMTIPMTEISFDNDGDFIIILDYDVIGKHPNDEKKTRCNKFIVKIDFTYINGTSESFLRQTTSYREVPIISDAEDRDNYYKKPLQEVFIIGKEELFTQNKNDIESINISVHMGEFSSNTYNRFESIPKVQYGISKLSLITLDVTSNIKGIYLDKDVWYDFESLLTKSYYDTDFFSFKLSYEDDKENFYVPPVSYFWYPISVSQTSPNSYLTVNNVEYPKKALQWLSKNENDSGTSINEFLNYYNTINLSIPQVFELTIFEVDDDNNTIVKQLLIDRINLTDIDIYDYFGLEEDKEYKFAFRIPNLLYKKSDNTLGIDYIKVENAYSEGKYTLDGISKFFSKDWYKIAVDYSGTIKLRADKDTRISFYRLTHYNVNKSTIANYPYKTYKLLGSNNYQENEVTFTIENKDIYTSTTEDNTIFDFIIEVSLRNEQRTLNYEISANFNDGINGYTKIDDYFKNLSSTSINSLFEQNINTPAYFIDYPLTLPLTATQYMSLENDNTLKYSYIYPYNPNYNSIYKLINSKFDIKEEIVYTDISEYDKLDDIIDELRDNTLKLSFTEEQKKLLLRTLCNNRFLKNVLKVSDIINTINNRFNYEQTEDMWIYEIEFFVKNSINYMDGTILPINGRMKGIFGIYINYNSQNLSYLLIWNFGSNSFIKSGLYRYNNSFSKDKYNELMDYNTFTERFKLLKEIDEFNSSLKFIIMKYKNYILIRKDDNRESFFTFTEEDIDGIPLQNGTIGNFSYQIENLGYKCKLWK